MNDKPKSADGLAAALLEAFKADGPTEYIEVRPWGLTSVSIDGTFDLEAVAKRFFNDLSENRLTVDIDGRPYQIIVSLGELAQGHLEG